MTASASTGRAVRIAVVGAGVSGLVAAYRLRQALGATAVVDVFDASDTPGGLLSSRRLDGQLLDSGAESFIVRRPEAVGLIEELGLADRVVRPTSRRPAILAGGRLRDLPRPTLMGIPANAGQVVDLAEPADVERMRGDVGRPMDWTPGSDRSVGELVADRFGRSVVDRSVDPMLSGVYSCRSDDIGLRASLPALAARLDSGAPDLTSAVNGLLPPPSTAPVFGALDGGYRLLVDRLVSAGGATMHLGSPVASVDAEGAGWTVTTDSGRQTSHDAVVVALPAPAAAAVVATAAPHVARGVATVATASTALVMLALAPDVALPDHSGVLMATGEATTAKAITLSSQKWAHLATAGGPGLVRASFGRYGDPVDHLSDDDLVAAAVTDLSTVVELAGASRSITAADLVDATVQRWPVGLPRYAPGHRELVTSALADVPPGLVFCGAAYDGVGVPACIARAGVAAAQVVTHLADRGPHGGGTMGS
ncbi:FAD-dependent oxidoreductase [Williamsia sp. MIQD14]|uniref:FAD-dependent oxidoreductase n=1 Tax=Williamsia sp. MIQD14 TaxID=3425703 RepID=UPI003DA02DF6